MLFVGDDWAEDHHDVALINQEGRLLTRGRLPEGVQGIEALHRLIADHLDERDGPEQVMVGIETDRGPAAVQSTRPGPHRMLLQRGGDTLSCRACLRLHEVSTSQSCVQRTEAATAIKKPDQPVHNSIVKSQFTRSADARLLFL
nr:transposase [Arthrobacter sp. OV608]